MTNTAPASPSSIIETRRREMAIEHLLFGTIRFVAERHPDLLDALDGSLDGLWDKADEASRDDEAVRAIARRFIRSLRAETSESEQETPADDAVTAALTAPGGAL